MFAPSRNRPAGIPPPSEFRTSRTARRAVRAAGLPSDWRIPSYRINCVDFHLPYHLPRIEHGAVDAGRCLPHMSARQSMLHAAGPSPFSMDTSQAPASAAMPATIFARAQGRTPRPDSHDSASALRRAPGDGRGAESLASKLPSSVAQRGRSSSSASWQPRHVSTASVWRPAPRQCTRR